MREREYRDGHFRFFFYRIRFSNPVLESNSNPIPVLSNLVDSFLSIPIPNPIPVLSNPIPILFSPKLCNIPIAHTKSYNLRN